MHNVLDIHAHQPLRNAEGTVSEGLNHNEALTPHEGLIKAKPSEQLRSSVGRYKGAEPIEEDGGENCRYKGEVMQAALEDVTKHVERNRGKQEETPGNKK